jgi:hypothetical protein
MKKFDLPFGLDFGYCKELLNAFGHGLTYFNLRQEQAILGHLSEGRERDFPILLAIVKIGLMGDKFIVKRIYYLLELSLLIKIYL